LLTGLVGASDAFAEVVADHGGVSAVEGGVVGGAAEDFGDEGCDVLEVLLRHVGEERSEDGVGGNFFVEAAMRRLRDSAPVDFTLG